MIEARKGFLNSCYMPYMARGVKGEKIKGEG